MQEDKGNMAEEIILKHKWYHPEGVSLIEWLQYIADSFSGVADLWDEYDSNYFEEEVEFHKDENPDISKMEMYFEISHTVGESLLHSYLYDSMDVAKEIEYFRKLIIKAFEKSVVFSYLIDAIGIIESVMKEAKSCESEFYYYQYYNVVDAPEEAVEWFGNSAAKRFDKERELTAEDYENAFECITELLKIIEKQRFSEKLRDSAYAIKGYCKLKADSPERYAEIEKKIAKKRSPGKLNEMVGNILKTSPNMKARDIAKLINRTSTGVEKPTSADAVRKTESWKNRNQTKSD